MNSITELTHFLFRKSRSKIFHFFGTDKSGTNSNELSSNATIVLISPWNNSVVVTAVFDTVVVLVTVFNTVVVFVKKLGSLVFDTLCIFGAAKVVLDCIHFGKFLFFWHCCGNVTLMVFYI